MRSTAFFSHPYGHETLGYREDIEDFTAAKLQRFYNDYYRPDNATLMIIGDIDRKTALTKAKEYFGTITNPPTPIPRFAAREKKQEGIRRVTVERPSAMDILGIGFKHPAFPAKDWFVSNIMLDILVGGPESVLHRLLVDTGKVAKIDGHLEPTSDENISIFTTTLNQGHTHEEIETLILTKINSLTIKDISTLITKSKAGMITDELFGRTESLHIVSELTEYASAGNLPAYGKTTEILADISPKEVLERIRRSFTPNNLTIGYFKGKN
jgi:zinc protease